jgi:peptide/nickel transport system substrate-binding protein
MESIDHSEPAPMPTSAAPAPEEAASSLTRVRSHYRLRYLEDLLRSFTPLERLALYGLTIILGLSVLVFVAAVNNAISTAIPARGGSITEGETVPARFVNPVLALSQADQDIAMLVYSGLVRARADGTFIPDLADHYSISQDGITYTFTIRPDATFHDGTPVTAADVLYTVSQAQNPDIKSPRRADWEGVQVSSPDDHTVIFTLPHAYAPFMENATLGILPSHLWRDVPAGQFAFSTFNTHPVGSGPYRVANTQTDATGAATRFELVPFERFTLGSPHLAHINFSFFTSDEALVSALVSGKVDAIAGVTPSDLVNLPKPVSLIRSPLPRVFGVFLNETKNPVLADPSVRAALAVAIDKPALVKNVLSGFGIPISNPIPPGVVGTVMPSGPRAFSPSGTSTAVADPAFIGQAKQLLQKGSWTYDQQTGTWTKKKATLAFKLATADAPELVATAQAAAAAWRAVGVRVDIQVYSLSEFNNTILRPRDYDAILFGEVVGRDADLFAFWHTSQRNDPGLNLALYANSKADALLSQARGTTDKRKRDDLYVKFAQLVETDQPAIFLYSPEFLYILPSEVQGVRIGALTSPSERFLEAYEWYTETQRVWEFFAH